MRRGSVMFSSSRGGFVWGAEHCSGPGYSQRFMDSKEQECMPRIRVKSPKVRLAAACGGSRRSYCTFPRRSLSVRWPGARYVEVWAGTELVWSRAKGASVPEIKALKAKLVT